MSTPSRKLQNSLSDILQDLMSMSADVIKKAKMQLDEVEDLDELSVANVASKMKKLLNRVTTNVDAFAVNFDASMQEYQSASENSSPKNVPEDKQDVSEEKQDVSEDKQDVSEDKKDLCVQKNGDMRETDVDLTQSDEELESTPTKKTMESPKPESQPVEENGLGKEPVVDDDVSDTDSEKTVLNFDVPITKTSAEGLSDCDIDSGEEFSKTLDELEKTANEAIEKEEIKSFESASFDFDEETPKEEATIKTSDSASFDFDDIDDQLNAAMDKFEKTGDTMGQVQQDNRELLDLLTRAVGDEDYNEEAIEALKILDDDLSLSSDAEWEDDDDKSMKSLKSSSEDDRNGSETEGHMSDTESLAEDEQSDYKLKEFDINLEQRLDEMGDAEIARLCNVENINKRKCVKELRNLRRRKLKRIKLMSSSSSSSDDDDSSGSATPDLVFDTQRSPSPPLPNIELPGMSVLADECMALLDDDDKVTSDVSSESSSDLELESESSKDDEKPTKEQHDIKETVEEVNVKSESEEEEMEKKVKRRSSWKGDRLLFDSSTDSETDEPVFVPNDPLEDKVEIDDDDSKEKMKLKFLNDGETMIITDSDSAESDSDSDSVTYVGEVTDDDVSGPGGRRNIRTILSDSELSEMTQRAKCEEDERIMRLEERSKTIESIQSQHEEFVLDVDVKSGEPLVTVDYNIAKFLKPHQREGVKFMWEACYESVEVLKTKPGTGCILAHCMGLGKTLQVITLIHALFKHPSTRTRRVLITCPLSTVTNWKNEFTKTFRKLSLPLNLPRYFIVKDEVREKIRTISRWHKDGGVLAMGYETFTMLTHDKLASRVSADEKEITFKALLDPGPDLIICDEGHQLKNEKTLRTKALMKVKTKRRIVLTGTPLQNNLKEYYFMVEFVKPHLLGTATEYTNRFALPIQNGQYHNSTQDDIKLMKKRTHVLTKLLKKTIHRVEAGVLSSYLPEIVDYTIFVKLTPLQMELYTKYITMVTTRGTELLKGFFADIMMLNFNNLHPYTVQLYYNKPKPKKKKKNPEDGTPDDDQDEDVDRAKQDWFRSSLPVDISTNVAYSTKLNVVLRIVDEARRMGDKVLIFAQKLVELDVLEHFFKLSRNWQPKIDYYRMDGRTSVEDREHLCTRFNLNPGCKVFLLTHRVGGLGLNLIGANRVIMIGSNHNPSLDTQSMYRVYRFGQKKKCYVYRLLSLATMEEKIYRRCVVKLHLSGTVVDKLHYTRKFMATDLQEMYNIDFEEYEIDRPIPAVPQDLLLAMLLQNIIDIYRYHPHNSLLENRPEEELTDEDKTLAWDEFNNMEETAKHANLPAPPLAFPPTINPMLLRLPVYPANPVFPFNRFGQLCSTRATSTTLVPNPVNSNVRGFIPRGLLTNGMPHQTPSNVNRVPNGPTNIHNFFRSNGNAYPRVGAPAPRPRDVTPPQTSQYNPRVSAQTVGSRIATSGTFNPPVPSVHYRPTAPRNASEILRNIREEMARKFREQQRSAASDEPPSSGGEFNYALNKVV